MGGPEFTTFLFWLRLSFEWWQMVRTNHLQPKIAFRKYKMVVYVIVVVVSQRFYCEKYYIHHVVYASKMMCIEFPFIWIDSNYYAFHFRSCLVCHEQNIERKKDRPREQQIRIKRFCVRHEHVVCKVMQTRMKTFDGYQNPECCARIFCWHTPALMRAHTHTYTHLRWLRRPTTYRCRKKNDTMVKWKFNQTTEMESNARTVQTANGV